MKRREASGGARHIGMLSRAAPLVTVAVMGLFILAMVAFLLLDDRNRRIEIAYVNAENLAEAMSEYSTQRIAAIDQALLGFAGTARDDIDRPLEGLHIHGLLVERQVQSPGVLAIFVLDRTGRLTHTSRTAQPEPVDLSDREAFHVHRDDAAVGRFVDRPVVGRVGFAKGRWIVNISRRINAPDGSFVGVVVAAVDLESFAQFYASMRTGDDGLIALFRSDGVLYARGPDRREQLGRSFADTPLFTKLLPAAASGRYEGRSTIDGIARLLVYRSIPEMQTVVVVGVSRKEVLQGWALQAWGFGGAATVLFAGFMALSLVASRAIARRNAARAEQSRRLALLAQASTELVRAPSLDALLAWAAPLARRLIGAERSVLGLGRDRARGHLRAVSLSGRHADGPDDDREPDGADLDDRVCRDNRTLRLSRADLERHPAWSDAAGATLRREAVRGWLAVPMIAQSGENLGVIRLSDRHEGDFTEDDEATMVQFAQIVSVVVENLDHVAARQEALEAERRERLAADEARREVETVLGSISEAFMALDASWKIVFVNKRTVELTRLGSDDLLGRNIWEVFPEAAGTQFFEECHLARETGDVGEFLEYFARVGIWIEVRVYPHSDGLTLYFRDVSEIKETEEKLRQSQKMEAIGQLTGGVAHDFNNLLTTIMGNVDLLIEEDETPPAIRERLAPVLKAAENAADLTRRLLAFSRKQPLEPKVVSLNDMLTSIEGLLARTVGAQYDIETVKSAGLWSVEVDPAQMETAMLNLIINGRDAMPEGGKLTVETANVRLDDAYADGVGDIPAGQYVLVAVTDTGDGMAPDVAARAFEPFFTTKEVGKGSGLGLSMIYGFVKQSGGHVRIYSEIGQGTTVKMYFPRARGKAEPAGERVAVRSKGGAERILLVEDEEMVREYTARVLADLGYSVTAVERGEDAVAEIDGGARFDLLLTDVVLPGAMNGREVADETVRRLPGIRVLFTSGYTENAIVHQNRLDDDVELLSKPFRRAELARKVRRLLDGA